MEEDKKKKKNKKKKNKQAKASDGTVNGGVPSSVQDQQNHVPAVEQNQCVQTEENADVHNALVVSESDAKMDEQPSDGVGKHTVHEEEKQIWLKREKCLEEQIQQFQLAKHDWISKEASWEEKVKQLQMEKESCIQKEKCLEEQIQQFQLAKHDWTLQKASLEDKVKQLQTEKASCIQKEAELEDNIKRLESDKESWALTEASTKDIVTRLNEDNIQLQNKVNGLEAFRDQLLQENQRLAETITVLDSQIENLVKDVPSHVPSTTETVHDNFQHKDANALMEAAVVERRTYENAQLVDKVLDPLLEVNEPNIELARRNSTAENSSVLTVNSSVEMPETSTTTTDYTSEPSGKIPQSTEGMDAPGTNPNKDQRDRSEDADLESIAVTEVQIEESSGTYETDEIEEIVQVPLHDNAVSDLEVQNAETDGITDVPLTDAPLIGAPFRLISFFAKYVSGADLVNKNTDSGR